MKERERLSYDGYTLAFADDFDGAELNRNDWSVELHEPGWVNEEWQRYVDSPENIRLADGKLMLLPVKRTEADGSVSYTSGRVSTQGKREFTYGIFEVRAKVPRGKGYLPAFWLMTGDELVYEPWPVCGEIDVMEVLGHQTDTAYGTIHYGLPHKQNQGIMTLKHGNFADEYHAFALKWEPGRLRWYVDGGLYHEVRTWFSHGRNRTDHPFPAPFDHDMYLILNLAIGGNWVGYPDETTDFEHAAYAVDYVKVYQKSEVK